MHKLFKKELCINYFPEIWNGCDVWEQAFRRRMLTDWATRRLLNNIKARRFFIRPGSHNRTIDDCKIENATLYTL